MPPASNEEQFKFLISCIRYSNNGKVDFGQVAQECKIVSKGAAAKRYERMMRAHGIAPNAAAIKPVPSRAIKAERSNFTEKPSKKRKTDTYVEENDATDDDESFCNNVKPDPADHKDNLMIKEEEYVHDQHLSMHEAASLMQYYGNPSPYSDGIVDELDYLGKEYADPAGYATPNAAAYGPQSQQPYGFGSAYADDGMNDIPRTADQSLSYQPMMMFPSDHQGRPDSPVILE